VKDPAVVVLTNERDFAADDVIRRLQARGVEVQRLNIEQARAKSVGRWSPGPDDTVWGRATAIWWRQFETDDSPETMYEVDDVLVERAQWRVWAATLASPGATWVNDLWAARRAENKVEQLRTAHEVGFTVPPTVVTNDPDDAHKFQNAVGPCVIKTLTSAYHSFSDQSFVFTELLDDAINSEGWHRVPVVVQQLIDGGLDARLISFGDRCYAAKCRSRGLDWRKTPFEPDLWHHWQPPTSLERACVMYRDRLGLEYAAFDFMITDDGSVRFLEANQAGEWVFLDRTLDLGRAPALADHLADRVVGPALGRSVGSHAPSSETRSPR
jgi:glutathione synthase/RimK-type ligase-like ATP-grasp enzyme